MKPKITESSVELELERKKRKENSGKKIYLDKFQRDGRSLSGRFEKSEHNFFNKIEVFNSKK